MYDHRRNMVNYIFVRTTNKSDEFLIYPLCYFYDCTKIMLDYCKCDWVMQSQVGSSPFIRTRILEDVRDYNEKHGFDKEWIFQSDNEKYGFRLSYDSANNKLAKLCKRIGTKKKSVHKIRKTVLSLLMTTPGVNQRTIMRFAGHADITTTLTYYVYDVNSLEQQARQIERALAAKE